MEETVTVHVVIREDQNEHGFIDTSVGGLFRSRNDANAVRGVEHLWGAR
jgi:hypothetical protein